VSFSEMIGIVLCDISCSDVAGFVFGNTVILVLSFLSLLLCP